MGSYCPERKRSTYILQLLRFEMKKKKKTASCQNYVPQRTSHKKLTSRKINHLHSFGVVWGFMLCTLSLNSAFRIRSLLIFFFFSVFNICKCKQNSLSAEAEQSDCLATSQHSAKFSNPWRTRYSTVIVFGHFWRRIVWAFCLTHLILPFRFPPPILFSLDILLASNILET